MTERTPSRVGPPGCWGFFRGDDACDACAYAKRCRRSFQRRLETETVADAATHAPPQTNADTDPAELCAYAQRKYVAQGGKPFPKWTAQVAFLDAMTTVIAACQKAAWNPKRFVVAQIEAMTPNIERGWPIRPGTFTTVKALFRFQSWIDRRRRRYGDARRDTTEQVDVEAAKAAAFAYATARLFGRGHRRATLAARAHVPGWERNQMAPHLRAPALAAALSSFDPVLPQMILPPAEWTWKDVAVLGRHLRGPPRGGRGPSGTMSTALGEFV
jgi:hypothetical protein